MAESTPALVCACAATVLAGVLVGRWWLLLVPTVPALVIIFGALLSGRDPGERWDAAPADYAVAYLTAWAIIAGLLAIGVAVHKLLAAAQHRTTPRAPRRLPS